MVKKYTNFAVYRLGMVGGIRFSMSGPPSCGKTTQMAEFIQSGFIGVPEYATILMQQAKSCAGAAGLKLPDGPQSTPDPRLVELFRQLHVFHPFVDNPAFQEALTIGCLQQEHPYVQPERRGLVCFDRTHLDAVAYCEHFGIGLPPQFATIVPPPKERFDLCFILMPFGQFVDNGIRIEKADGAQEFARIIGPRLVGVYRGAGVRVILVPPMKRKTPEESIAARHEFMWKHITRFAERKLARLEKCAA